jgi:peroxiredoxin
MRFKLLAMMTAVALAACLPSANAGVTVGEPAPDFTGTDTNGNQHSLSDFKGKNVVLEWSNHECPFVVKHYDSGNMQKLQKEATADGTIWLTIVSSADGKQGNLPPEEANKLMEKHGSKPTARILDTSGEIGKLYDAKTTPHMFVIDKEGVLVYKGAIDSDSSFKQEAIPGATNYVTAALDSLEAGEEIEVASTQPYGCSVKY